MRTIFKKMVMPAAAITLGVAGALSTQAMNSGSKTLSNQTGYRFVSAQDPCHAEIMCRTEEGDICKLGSNTLWGKVTPGAPTCPVTLYKIPN
ncbi:hypothetical protein [Flavobacterium pedocola]